MKIIHLLNIKEKGRMLTLDKKFVLMSLKNIFIALLFLRKSISQKMNFSIHPHYHTLLISGR